MIVVKPDNKNNNKTREIIKPETTESENTERNLKIFEKKGGKQKSK